MLGAALSAVAVVITGLAALEGLRLTVAPGDEQAESQTQSGPLQPGAIISQSVIARWPGLCRIEVRFSTAGAALVAGQVEFRLQAPYSPLVKPVTQQIDARQITDGQYYRFEFPALPNRIGETLYFAITAPEIDPDAELTLWGSPTPGAYALGQAQFHATPSNGLQDLAFRARYCPSVTYLLDTWLERATANRPGVLGQAWLYLAVICAFGVMLSWIGLVIYGADPVAAAPDPAVTRPPTPD